MSIIPIYHFVLYCFNTDVFEYIFEYVSFHFSTIKNNTNSAYINNNVKKVKACIWFYMYFNVDDMTIAVYIWNLLLCLVSKTARWVNCKKMGTQAVPSIQLLQEARLFYPFLALMCSIQMCLALLRPLTCIKDSQSCQFSTRTLHWPACAVLLAGLSFINMWNKKMSNCHPHLLIC